MSGLADLNWLKQQLNHTSTVDQRHLHLDVFANMTNPYTSCRRDEVMKHRSLFPISIFLLCGCATVNPSPDYDRASELIKERTGSTSVYRPDLEQNIDEEVKSLLQGGLSADEATSVALLNNREFQGLLFEVGISHADLVQSSRLSNPSIFLNVLIPQGGGRTKLTYGLTQELAELWQLPKRKRASKEKLEMAILQIAQVAIDLNRRTQTAYFTLLAADLTVQNAVESETLAQSIVSLVQSKYDAGEVSELDVNRARATLLNTTMDTILARQEQKVARATIEKELGLSYWPDPWDLTGKLELDNSVPVKDETLLAQATENILNVKLAKQQIALAESELKTQYRARFPSVKLGVSAERPAQKTAPSRAEQGIAAWKPSTVLSGIPAVLQPNPSLSSIAGLLPSFPTQRQRELAEDQQIDLLWGPTLQATVPIFDQNQAGIAKAQYRLEQLQKEYENQLQVLSQTITQKAATVRTARELATFFSSEAIPLAESNAKGASLVYESGQEGILSIVESQRELFSLRKTYIGVLRDYHVARVELEQAMGGKNMGGDASTLVEGN